jgi:hypothetical protein
MNILLISLGCAALIIYLIGVFMFFVYAACMNKGWNGTYAVMNSLGFAAKWPWTVARLWLERRS